MPSEKQCVPSGPISLDYPEIPGGLHGSREPGDRGAILRLAQQEVASGSADEYDRRTGEQGEGEVISR